MLVVRATMTVLGETPAMKVGNSTLLFSWRQTGRKAGNAWSGIRTQASTGANVEWAIYRIFIGEDGRRMGSFVNMFASQDEAEASVRKRDGEHEVVGLMTREISEEDEHLWNTVVFTSEARDGIEPVGEPGTTGGA